MLAFSATSLAMIHFELRCQSSALRLSYLATLNKNPRL
jgi:hypothetical protein